ncbi:MAG: PIN domain-containing protein [Anaerolineae bacterium]|nr:PIN domain-containing protein [Anaerolineae bacterium]
MDKILLDTSFVYALYDHKDPYHNKAREFTRANRLPFLLPDVVLVEASFFAARSGGTLGQVRFLDGLWAAAIPFEPIHRDDLPRIRTIMHTYADSKLDMTDCCIMALAERLNISRVATFDRRDFAIFRPTHCPALELLP